jgi:hypothetical protein
MPEKSGIDAAPCVTLPAGVAGRVCPNAGVAAIAASPANKTKFRCAIMLSSYSSLPAPKLNAADP